MRPLHVSSSLGNLELTELLLKAGADLNAKTSVPIGTTPLQYAAMNGHKN